MNPNIYDFVTPDDSVVEGRGICKICAEIIPSYLETNDTSSKALNNHLESKHGFKVNTETDEVEFSLN